MKPALKIGFAAFLLCAVAIAETLTGTVTNGTVGKPAANASVTLLSLMNGMQESAHAKTDAAGRFTLNVPDAGAPHLVRVSFSGVNYHKMAPPGSTTADVTVYEAAPKVDGISVSVETAFETSGADLKCVHFYTVKNASQPPRTLGGDKSLEIVLPDGATIDSAEATGPGGQPVQQSPFETGTKNHYAFNFPVRPGETVFQIGYHVPYNGALAVSPKILYPLEQFAVILPEQMKFEAKSPEVFESPNHQGGVALRIATAPKGKDLSYKISGTGTFPEQTASQGPSGPADVMGGGGDPNRPGGGLGAPIDAPDPLSRTRIPIIAMLSGVMALAALFMVVRRGHGSNDAQTIPPPAVQDWRGATRTNAAKPTGEPLLDALKDELFQLELDRQNGTITLAEYEDHKAALTKTIKRAVARNKT